MKKILILIISVFVLCALSSCNKNDEKTSNKTVSNGGFNDALEYWHVKSSGISIYSENENNCLKIINNNSLETIYQKIKNVKPGLYSLKAKTKNDCNQEYCYIYGKGSAQEAQMTSLPLSYQNDWVITTVRGIKVLDDGELEIGIKSYGLSGLSYFDDFELVYEENQNEITMLYGGAISWLDWEESLGAKYYDFLNNERDALEILKENGCNVVRLELYNNPGEYINEFGDYFPKDFKNQDSIFNLAKRANKLGMKIQLSFMYSDYWGNDSFPVDWKEIIDRISDYDKKIQKLSDLLYDFTYNYIKRFIDNSIFPDYVSLGNEIDPGILLPYGSSTSSEESVNALAKLLNSGYKAVKDASPSSLVVLHLGCNANDMHWESKNGGGRWFFDLMKGKNVNYDIIGTSFYPYWAQTESEYAKKKSLDLNDFKEWCIMMNNLYDKKILIMETGYNWGIPGQLSNNGAYENIYESTPNGQRNYIYDLINTIKGLENNICLGFIYWDPILVKQDGIGYALYENGKARPNVVETTTFFDYNHKALPVLNAYKYN